MRRTETILLKKPLKGPNNQMFDKIVLREPTFDEYLEFGDPYTIAQAAGGTPFAVENVEVIKNYIKLCLVEPADPQILQQGNANLGREVKERLFSFFQPDKTEGEGFATSQMNSPSEASGSAASEASKD